MEKFCLARTDSPVCDKARSENLITHDAQTEHPSRTRTEFNNQDHIRHYDQINVDMSTSTITRDVRIKFEPVQSLVTYSDSYPLREKKISKAVVKKPIVWPNDPEMKAQGQNAEGELMD